MANLSYSSYLPATVSWADNNAVLTIQAVTANDVLVVTSAGNNGDDLDEQDCFVACWEAQHAMPCEVDNVLCVGGLQRNSLDAHSSSNYGDEVTLWAPYITRR